MKLSIEEINALIDDEIKCTKEFNSAMALGMEQIKRKINMYSDYKKAQNTLKEE